MQFYIEGEVMEVLMIFYVLFCNTGKLCGATENDNVVNIGVVLNYHSCVGKVSKSSLEMTQDGINKDT
jgi:hypothetical protein